MRIWLVFLLMTFSAVSAVAWDDAAKKVSESNISVQSHKYDDKLIEVTMRCFYADTNDIRCMAGYGSARVDFTTANGDGISGQLYDQCDDIGTAFEKKTCRFDVQFIYAGFSEMDNGISKMTVVQPKDGIGEFRQHGKRH